ncbi:hypothetical protein [Microbacterium arborescens]|uniref:hypothetical protein n=1 Tax=Microbacterium arborescens TaxID=33883 RepID=UPI0027D8A741|nr:hypothetical protein [Microbacterium arborescens]
MTVVVVLPTPPFWFETVITRVSPEKAIDTASSARRRDDRSASSRASGESNVSDARPDSGSAIRSTPQFLISLYGCPLTFHVKRAMVMFHVKRG